MIQPYLGVVAAIALVGTHWWAFQTGKDAELGVQAREDAIAIKAADSAASAAVAAINRIEVKHVTIRQELEREIRTREVFRDCRSGPGPVGLFNSSIPGYAAASAPAGASVPATNTDHGR